MPERNDHNNHQGDENNNNEVGKPHLTPSAARSSPEPIISSSLGVQPRCSSHLQENISMISNLYTCLSYNAYNCPILGRMRGAWSTALARGLFQQFSFHFSMIWESLEIKKAKCMSLIFTIICFRSLQKSTIFSSVFTMVCFGLTYFCRLVLYCLFVLAVCLSV